MKRMFFSLLFSFKCKFTSIPFLFIFFVISYQNNCWNTETMHFAFKSTCHIYWFCDFYRDFSEDRSFIAICKMKWSRGFFKDGFIKSSIHETVAPENVYQENKFLSEEKEKYLGFLSTLIFELNQVKTNISYQLINFFWWSFLSIGVLQLILILKLSLHNIFYIFQNFF